MIKYVATENGDGVHRVLIDKIHLGDYPVKRGINNEVITEKIGVATMGIGQHSIVIEPARIGKQELMKLLEIQLRPLIKN